MHPEARSACQQLRGFTNQNLAESDSDFEVFYDLGKFLFEKLGKYIQLLSLADLNYIIYQCHEEEEVNLLLNGTYNVPDYGDLVYCGLQGNLEV